MRAEGFLVHDPLVIHWLVGMGMQCLITDFSAPVPGSLLASSTIGPPKELLDLQEGKAPWLDFWSGSMSIGELMQQKGSSIAMTPPDRSQHSVSMVAKLQRDLMELFQGIRQG